MTLGHGAKIATNGLVFAYDMDSIRSYNGPQTTNSATGIVPVYNTQTALFTMYPTYEDVNIPQLGWVRNCLAMTMYNDYNGGSGNCCPSPIVYYTGSNTTTNVKPSTLYTYAIVYKSTNGYTHPNFMYRYEYGPSGYLTEGGIHNTGNRIHLGNDWYWAWGTFTTQSATTSINPRCFQYQYATWNKLYLAKVMLIEGNYTGLHPRFWPDLSETIDSTNSVLDWTSNQTITSNITYNSDGTFTLNSSNPDYLDLGSDKTIKTSGGWTVETWVKYDTVPGGYDNVNSPGNFIGSDSISYNSWYWSVLDGKLALWNRSPGIWKYGSTTLQANTWYNAVLVSDPSGTSYQMYLNGVAEGGDHTTYSWNASYSGLMVRYIGRGNANNTRRLNGMVPVTKIYNRALTATEVAQNFNALKGRFGI